MEIKKPTLLEKKEYDPWKQFPPTFNEKLFMKICTQILTKHGYEHDKIQWNRTGISNDIYLRYGYWERISIPKRLDSILNMDSYDDEDCGTLYKYNLRSSDERNHT